MRGILRPFRLIGVVLIIVSFLATMSVVWLIVRDRWRRTRLSNKILSYFCIWALWNLDVRPTIYGEENLRGTDGLMLVGNHLTYVDVLVIASRVPICFVTSTEIKRAPVLGQICQMAGCLFVERKNKMNILNEVSEIHEGLANHLNVAVFPEATSTNGEKVLRFRKPLYLSAISAEKPVIPFCLNYRTVGGETINRINRDSIFWYGDMEFASHVWRLSGAGGSQSRFEFPGANTGEQSRRRLGSRPSLANDGGGRLHSRRSRTGCLTAGAGIGSRVDLASPRCARECEWREERAYVTGPSRKRHQNVTLAPQ